MKTVRLQVQDGKLVGDAPASLREGAVVHAVIADREEEMSAEELAELNRTLDESWDELEAGREIGVPFDDAQRRGVRRYLLWRTEHHLYDVHVAATDTVRALAVIGARRRGPPRR